MFNENETIEGLGAELYDQHETQTDDVEFILSVIGRQPKKVLEVCCGSGRILVPLAKAGHNATGFDIDETMMDRIPSKAAGLKNVQWHKADAVHDDWGTGFDVVVLAGNILFNIVSNIEYKKAQELFIQKAADALLPGGYVYIGYSPFAPNGRTLTRPAGFSCEDDGSIVWSWEGTDDAGNYEKDSLTKGSFDEETGILKARRFSEIRLVSGKVIKEETEGSMKHYATLEQIHEWLFNAGFVIKFEYEDFDKTPINDESQSVIIYARKKGQIEYKKIDSIIFNKLVDINGDDGGIIIRDDTFTLAAMDGDFPAGYICVTPRNLRYPLEHIKEAFIEVLDVDENYRRQGIGQHLVQCGEAWAIKNGLRQIRTHSNDKAVEAIHMWNKLGYGLCPHVYYAEEGCTGYWVAKTLKEECNYVMD